MYKKYGQYQVYPSTFFRAYICQPVIAQGFSLRKALDLPQRLVHSLAKLLYSSSSSTLDAEPPKQETC